MDIMRGYLQLVIFASHAYGSFIGGWMIHASWGFSDSSEQFVFLSGFTLGSVFALKASRQGLGAARWDMLGRAARLYRTHLIVMALFFSMLVLACEVSSRLPMEAQRLGWGTFIAHPFLALPGLLVMLYQPAFMGILPIFIWCMALLPLFAWGERRMGNGALAISFAVYLASWVFWIELPALGQGTKIGFNPLTWQFVFLFGAWLGHRALRLGQALPPMRWLTVAAASLVLAGIYLRVGWYGWFPLPAPFAENVWIVGKDTIALPRLLHALALAWLVSVFVPREADWMHGAVARWMATIGRYSLQVFCLGLFLSWGCTAVFRLWPAAWWLDPVLIAVGVVILGGYARQLDARRGSSRQVAAA